jgi:hypothetical protein
MSTSIAFEKMCHKFSLSDLVYVSLKNRNNGVFLLKASPEVCTRLVERN